MQNVHRLFLSLGWSDSFFGKTLCSVRKSRKPAYEIELVSFYGDVGSAALASISHGFKDK